VGELNVCVGDDVDLLGRSLCGISDLKKMTKRWSVWAEIKSKFGVGLSPCFVDFKIIYDANNTIYGGQFGITVKTKVDF
jgi:hypothetical protein